MIQYGQIHLVKKKKKRRRICIRENQKHEAIFKLLDNRNKGNLAKFSYIACWIFQALRLQSSGSLYFLILPCIMTIESHIHCIRTKLLSLTESFSFITKCYSWSNQRHMLIWRSIIISFLPDHYWRDPAVLFIGDQCFDWSCGDRCSRTYAVLCGHAAFTNTEKYTGEHQT